MTTRYPLYNEALRRFEHQPVVTIATGATCAYLGDERNLREYLIADETAKHLQHAGHTVFLLLFDDSLDPLDFRQLRVALNKDETLIERHKDWCGKPIGHLPDPWGCHDSYAGHFEHALLDRLHRLGSHPTLVSTAKLYAKGMYAPYVQIVLEQHDAILRFLEARFDGYHPEKLFWPICPDCGYMDEARLETCREGVVTIHCARCSRETRLPLAEVRGKLNWKLDCAARWNMFHVDAEPFNKSYLEPKAGTFTIAQALSQEFFGGQTVLPLQYGLFKMEKAFSYTLLEALPPSLLRSFLTERPSSDLTLTRNHLLTIAERHEALPELSYLNVIKQLLPVWLLTPERLSPQQRELMTHGVAFARHFLDADIRTHLPKREHFEDEEPAVLHGLHRLIGEVVCLRANVSLSWDAFFAEAKDLIASLGPHKKAILHRLRLLVGQQQGLPVARFLFLLSLDYLRLLEHLLDLHLANLDENERFLLGNAA